MRYNQIRECDIANGEGIGIALFVQGCHFKCKNCFNPETWDFNGGKEWTPEIEDKFIELANKPYIKRISILGGEPLADENLDEVLNLVNKLRLLLPEKTIWLYSGYRFEECLIKPKMCEENIFRALRYEIIKNIDVMIDGKYIDSQRNISLKWRGSENQRVINVKETLKQGEVVLYCE
jgi:anaerobic ribonucleoside-triphosphate reductase activating protein